MLVRIKTEVEENGSNQFHRLTFLHQLRDGKLRRQRRSFTLDPEDHLD